MHGVMQLGMLHNLYYYPSGSPRGGRWYIGYSPSSKRVSRIKQKVGELLDRRNGAP